MSASRSLTQIEFYKLCQVLEKHREDFSKTHKTIRDITKVAATLSGLTVSEGALARAAKTVGIELRFNGQASPLVILVRKFNALGKVVRNLCVQLGVEFPKDIITEE